LEGGIGNQPFFIEGVREALDAKGEWWEHSQLTAAAARLDAWGSTYRYRPECILPFGSPAI
jgi:hypothetical protein